VSGRVSSPDAAAKEIFLAGLRDGLGAEEAAARTTCALRSFKLERRRDVRFALATLEARPGRRGKVERVADLVAVHLTPAERQRLVERLGGRGDEGGGRGSEKTPVEHDSPRQAEHPPQLDAKDGHLNRAYAGPTRFARQVLELRGAALDE
jgi:hypothetical protein